MQRIPVTLVSGFAGAGKTTVLRHLLAHREGFKMGVMVNDFRRADSEAPAAEGESALPLRPGQDRRIDLPNGCICCSLREDFLLEIRRAFRSRDFDYLLIEAACVARPLALAESLVVDDGRGIPISRNVVVDTTVTVVSAETFLADYASKDSLKDRGIVGAGTVGRRVADVLADQVELADVIVVSKADLVDEARLSAVEAVVTALNPYARVIRSARGEVRPNHLLQTGLFDFHAWTERAGTAADFNRTAAIGTTGLTRVAYRRFRPFHPERFAELAHADWPGIIRSRGIFWLASRNDTAQEWSQVGTTHHHHPAGSFWAATPEQEWQVGDDRRAKIKSIWSEPFGDRRQELILIGRRPDCEALEKLLDACLLTDAELEMGPEGWKSFEDDFHDH